MTFSFLRITVTAMTQTPNQKLASILLGQDVRDWIRARRDEGRSWRMISRDLYDQTNKQVDVTYEALRAWLDEAA